MEITGKIAVSTGGAIGIGKGLVVLFHQEGAAPVVVADSNVAGACAVAQSVNGTGLGVNVTDGGRDQRNGGDN